MEAVITALIFIGYLLAFFLCLAALGGGIYLATSAYTGRFRSKDEAAIEYSNSGLKVYFKGTGGILLAIAGVVGCCFIVYHYWQVLLGALVIIAGGGETVRRRSKKKTVKKKIAKKRVTKKKMTKKKYL